MDELNNMFKKSAEEFTMIPAYQSWEIVEKAIRERERKKRFLWLFFTAAGIATCAFLLLKDIESKTESSSTSHSTSEFSSTITQIESQNVSKEKLKTVGNSNVEIKESETQINSDVIQSNSKNQTYHSTVEGSDVIAIDSSANWPQGLSAIAGNQSNQGSIFFELIPSIGYTYLPNNSAAPDYIELLNFTTQSQTNDSTLTKNNFSHWSCSIGAGKAMSFYQKDEKGDLQTISNYRDSTDNSKITWNYGITLNYHVNKQFDFYTGLGQVNFKEELLTNQLVHSFDTIFLVITIPTAPDTILIPTTDYFHINNDSTGSTVNSFSYLEIPLGFRYHFLPEHRFNIAIQTQFSFNKLMKAKGYKYNYEQMEYTTLAKSDLKPWLTSYSLGMVFQYAVSNHYVLEFTPFYTNYTKSIYVDNYQGIERIQKVDFRLSFRYKF